jgi:3-dehydroquinate dehydratase
MSHRHHGNASFVDIGLFITHAKFNRDVNVISNSYHFVIISHHNKHNKVLYFLNIYQHIEVQNPTLKDAGSASEVHITSCYKMRELTIEWLLIA